ncbi:glutathione synthetase [Pontibacter akesuensis]|uniref:Glutathione synthetase n=1 Tax=Pontibacter akesuensis TaxID=388950 RepID=A0A1I7I021_9BACT|nr:glutathione synthetase [Pontibacter akesuensis]GHA64440.1 glutathione synthetase [Pontibacter akesuensis]SFU66231.1 glutathione synthase [Pontibacter akesuensis]
MTIGFVVNDTNTEKPTYSTIFLAQRMHNQGHTVYLMGVGDLAYYPDGFMGATAVQADPKKKYKTLVTYLEAIQGDKATKVRVTAPDLDVLMLRNDPSSEGEGRGWAQNAGIIFGQLALRHGVIVLNDPTKLSDAVNKMYFQHFPEAVRPRTLITRDKEEIKAFFREQENNIILKPLQGSGGSGVFMVKKDDTTNLNQIVEAISRDGYVIAQEYLPEATGGDVRLIVMNGEALQHEGKYCAIHRVTGKDDIRSNLHAGGSTQQATVTQTMLDLVELVRPKLIQDGMFLVGLDIVGNKLMEINVFSPGGLHDAFEMEGVDFSVPIIAALERKVHYKNTYSTQINNKTVAMI